jgi:hypothetical protein
MHSRLAQRSKFIAPQAFADRRVVWADAEHESGSTRQSETRSVSLVGAAGGTVVLELIADRRRDQGGRAIPVTLRTRVTADDTAADLLRA